MELKVVETLFEHLAVDRLLVLVRFARLLPSEVRKDVFGVAYFHPSLSSR